MAQSVPFDLRDNRNPAQNHLSHTLRVVAGQIVIFRTGQVDQTDLPHIRYQAGSNSHHISLLSFPPAFALVRLELDLLLFSATSVVSTLKVKIA